MGTRLKELRKEKNLTQQGLAEKAGISTREINRIENEGQIPSGKTLRYLAAALETTMAYILGETNEKNLPDVGASQQVRETV